MVALLQFGGMIIMGVFLLAGGNLVSYGKPFEFIGYMGIGFGVFCSCLLFYLADRLKMRDKKNIKQENESIIYRNVNKIIRNFKVKDGNL